MVDVDCGHGHTKYQPSNAEWRCPSCNADADYFYIDEGPNMDCPKVHKNDMVICNACGFGGSGTSVTNKMLKKTTRVVCPNCKGEGWVEKGNAR